MLGLFVFRPIVYKPWWDTYVGRFELYENLSFLSSLEVLLRTTDPYLWISDSRWRIFLTYLGTSSKWREFLPFRKPPNRRPPFFPLFRFRFHAHFRSRRISPKSETILHHTNNRLKQEITTPLTWFPCLTGEFQNFFLINIGFLCPPLCALPQGLLLPHAQNNPLSALTIGNLQNSLSLNWPLN